MINDLVCLHDLLLHFEFHRGMDSLFGRIVVDQIVIFKALRFFQKSLEAEGMVLWFLTVQKSDRIFDHHSLQDQKDDGTIMHFDKQTAVEDAACTLDARDVVIAGFQGAIEVISLNFVPRFASISLVVDRKELLRRHAVADVRTNVGLNSFIIEEDITKAIEITSKGAGIVVRKVGHDEGREESVVVRFYVGTI